MCLFFSQKGKGDIKMKGKHDPYAYIPLRKAQLNRRYGTVIIEGCHYVIFFTFVN